MFGGEIERKTVNYGNSSVYVISGLVIQVLFDINNVGGWSSDKNFKLIKGFDFPVILNSSLMIANVIITKGLYGR